MSWIFSPLFFKELRRHTHKNNIFSFYFHRVTKATPKHPFSRKRRLTDLSLSVLDLHQSVVGSIDYSSLLQWEKVSSAARRMSCFWVIKLLFCYAKICLQTTHPPLAWSPFPHKGRLINLYLSFVDL